MNDFFAFISGPDLIGAILMFVLGWVSHILAIRREKNREKREWRDDALSLIAEFHLLGRRVTEYQDRPDYELLRADLYDKAEEIGAHAESAPTEADRNKLRFLAIIGTSLEIIIKRVDQEDLWTVVGDMRDRVEEIRTDDTRSINEPFSILFGGDSPLQLFTSNDEFDSMIKNLDEESVEEIGERSKELIPDEFLEANAGIGYAKLDTEEALEVASYIKLNEFVEHLDPLEDDMLRLLIRLLMIEIPDIIHKDVESGR